VDLDVISWEFDLMIKNFVFIYWVVNFCCVAIPNIHAQTNAALASVPIKSLSVEKLRHKADEGNSAAQCALGDLFVTGVGVEKSDAEAIKWYRKAAEQGDATGQVVLAINYEQGRGGLTKNYDEAAKWYRKAAEQGNAQGQVGLGTLLRMGQGLIKNYDEAVKWFRKAADQGSVVGQANLGSMFIMGQGVEKKLCRGVCLARPSNNERI
jgi:TPR repeat protein